MIDAIGEFFRKRLQVQDDPLAVEESLRLAAAALLFETAMADYDLGDTERSTIHALVCSQFSLSDVDSKALLALAETQARDAIGLHGFTSLINQHWNEKDRLTLVEQMWRVVYADGRLDDH